MNQPTTNQSNTASVRRAWLAAASTAALILSSAAVSVAMSAQSISEGLLVMRAGTTYAVRSAQTQNPNVSIKNFGRVNENFYRGAQPGPEEFAELKRLGIKTVIDLRKDKKKDAAGWVSQQGMRYVNIPLKASQPATAEETEQFLKLVNDPENWPVYVHCKGGRHRTGALIAVYRITRDGWTADQAFKEMLDYDFDNGGFFGGGDGRARQKKFVYDFYASFSARAEGQP